MSERSKPINVFSIPTPTSRLSPLARPFTISNPFNRHELFFPLLDSSSLSTSSLDQPFPYLNLGGQRHHGYYAYHSDATAISAFPFVNDLDFEPNSCFTNYPFDDPPVQTHFTLPTHKSSQTSFTPSSSSFGNVSPESGVQGTATNQQGLEEVPHKNDQIGNVISLSCNNVLEQDTTIEGSKLVSETSSVLHEKGNLAVGKVNRIRPEDKDKIHTESSVFRLANSEVNLLNKCMTKSFSISLDLSFSPRPQDTQSQLSYSTPFLTLSHCDSTIINNERCFPHLASCAAEILVSCAPECFSYSAQTFKPSGAMYNPPIANPAPLENVAYGGTDAVSNMDTYFGYFVPGMIGSNIVLSPLDKVVCQDLVITKKGEKRNIVEPAHNENKNPSIMEKSKLQIACPNVHADLTLEHHGAKAGIPDDNCSTDSDDSDVDSPCWKGTQAYKSPLRDSVPVNLEESKGQSTSRVSVPLKLERSKNETVARNSLNPLAPVFIPGNSKQNVDYHRKECHGDSSLSSQNIGALALISSSREHGSIGSVEAGTCHSERINDIGKHCSNDVCDSRKEYGTPYKSSRSSVVNFSCSFQPYNGEEYVISESQLVRGTSVASCLEGIADATHNVLDSVEDIGHNGPNSSSSFPTTEIALNSHSIGDGVTSDLTERFQEPSKSTPPKLDVKLMINTIQYLSELLLHNYSFYLGSMSEHEHDKILNIINNLCAVIRNQAGERAIRPESLHLCTLYSKGQAADRHEVSKVGGKAVLHDQKINEISALTLSSRTLCSFYQSNDDQGGKVIEKDPQVIHSIEHEMPPEALFYRKLWLEAKATLYLMEYQVHGLHMEPEPDKC